VKDSIPGPSKKGNRLEGSVIRGGGI